MVKKKRWLTRVKRLFLLEARPTSEERVQKSKKWSWFFQRSKFRQYPTIEAPQRTLNDATEEHRKHALTVAIATAAAAEAALAAANAAAEVVRLSHVPFELQVENQYLAAIKIQSAYRGHLARKALSALKGIVKLQAMVRSQLVRDKIVRKLASTKLIDCLKDGELRDGFSPMEKINSEEVKVQGNNLRDWDFNMVSKEELEAFYLRKQDAIAKRERMKQYSVSNRERRIDESVQLNRKINRFDQCKESEVHQLEGTQKLTQLKLRTSLKQEAVENLHSPFSLPRRSFGNIKQKSIGDDGISLPSSPVLPPYMAATESAKAKCRSLSTPRQRLRLYETYSGPNSPHKISLSSWSSFNGDLTNSGKRNNVSKQT